MRVLIACEFSGRVRDAFIKRGHDAKSNMSTRQFQEWAIRLGKNAMAEQWG